MEQESKGMNEGGKFPVFNPARGFCPICGAPVTVVLNPNEPIRKIDCKSCGRISTFTVEIDWDWDE